MTNMRALAAMEEHLKIFFKGNENISDVVSFDRIDGDLTMSLASSKIDPVIEINLTVLAEHILKLPPPGG